MAELNTWVFVFESCYVLFMKIQICTYLSQVTACLLSIPSTCCAAPWPPDQVSLAPPGEPEYLLLLGI